MARRAIAILSFLGIIFGLAAWGGSFFNFFYNTQDQPNTSIQLKQGALFFTNGLYLFVRPTDASRVNWRQLPEVANRWGFVGYQDLSTVFQPQWEWGSTQQQITIPLWMPVLVCGGMYFFSSWVPIIRRRRRARAGRCINCGFDLRESSSGCPECGHGRPDFQPERYNRRGLIISGAVLVLVLVIAGGGYRLYGWVYRTVDYPMSNVLADAEGGSGEAFAELHRRMDAGVLSDAELRQLAGNAVRCFLSTVETDAASGRQWAYVLDRLDIDGVLDGTQQVQYYKRVIEDDLVLAETHVFGDPIVLKMKYGWRGGRSLWAEVASPKQVRLDGIALKDQAEGVYSSSIGTAHTLVLRSNSAGWSSWSKTLNDSPYMAQMLESRGHKPTHHFEWLGVGPGRHVLEIDEDHRLFRGDPDDPDPGPPIWSEQITHTVEFDILP